MEAEVEAEVIVDTAEAGLVEVELWTRGGAKMTKDGKNEKNA